MASTCAIVSGSSHASVTSVMSMSGTSGSTLMPACVVLASPS